MLKSRTSVDGLGELKYNMQEAKNAVGSAIEITDGLMQISETR
jgi:hypothetical protein